MAIAFEEAARTFVAYLAKAGKLDFLPERIGGWWGRDAEIDVLAISPTEGTALVGECKWSINPVGINILADLKQKAQILASDYGLQKIQYILFSRSGYTPALAECAEAEGIRLFTVDALVNPA